MDDERYRVEDMAGGDDCQDAIHTLYHYLDGELTAQRRETIRRHLDRCGPCLHAFDFEIELKAVIARSCRDQVPDHLRARIADLLHHEASGGNPGTV